MESKKLARTKKAVVAGHLCVDILPGLQSLGERPFFDLFKAGRLIEVDAAIIATGGAASNTGISLHKLGIETRIIGKIGTDMLGSLVKEVFRRVSPVLGTNLIVDSSTSTSYTVIINPPGIDRIFLHSPAANDSFCSTDIDYDHLTGIDLFHYGYPQLMRQMYIGEGREMVTMYQRLKSAGITTSLDVTFPDPSTPMGQVDWRKILSNTLPWVDIFCPSIEEILFMIFPQQYRALTEAGEILEQLTPALLHSVSDELLAMGAKIVLLKLGDRGLYLRASSELSAEAIGRAYFPSLAGWKGIELWSPCFEVQVVGTTGSGDATIAGFLASFLRELPAMSSVNMATAVGACNVECSDALSGVRDWDSTKTRVAEELTKKELILHDADWEYDLEYRIWKHVA